MQSSAGQSAVALRGTHMVAGELPVAGAFVARRLVRFVKSLGPTIVTNPGPGHRRPVGMEARVSWPLKAGDLLKRAFIASTVVSNVRGEGI